MRMWHFPRKAPCKPVKKRNPDRSQFYDRRYVLQRKIEAALDPLEAVYDLMVDNGMISFSECPSTFSATLHRKTFMKNIMWTRYCRSLYDRKSMKKIRKIN